MKAINIICLSSVLTFFANPVPAAVVDYKPIALEQAPAVDGPWRATPVRREQVTADGKLLVPAEANQGYWRLQISDSELNFSLGLPLINVPEGTLKIAQDFLASNTSRAGEDGQSESEWGSVRLADVATPIYDPAVDGGRTPAYMEFKVIAAVGDPTVGDPSVGDPSSYTPAPLRRDRGFIHLCLTEDDFPVIAWSTEGTTPVEQLRDAAGTATVKPVMFGPSLLVGETRDGRMAATIGSLLSKPHPDLMQFADVLGSSFYDSETGESNSAPAIPLQRPLEAYGSYQQMKDDYQTNDFYVSVRARKREAAKIEWLFARGATFPHLKVTVGDPSIQFAGREVRTAKLHAPDDARIALLTPLGREGLQIQGLIAGGGVLEVQFAGGEEEYFSLEVADPTLKTAQSILGGFTPSWKETKYYLAGNKDNQCWYSQFQSLDFGGGGPGNYVGCGPCAWTILMGWWDHQGVPVIFRPSQGSGLPNFKLGLADAPKGDNDSYVRSMMRAFRFQWVDPLYCDIFSGACGTPPDKMAEGTQYFLYDLQNPYNLLYEPQLGKKVLGHSYWVTWTWVSYNGVNDHNKLARESIEKGRPSIMGIGFLNHYIVAYAYLEKQYEQYPGVFTGWKAYLRCNWGNGSGGAKWINFQNDWFFATKARFWQTVTQYP